MTAEGTARSGAYYGVNAYPTMMWMGNGPRIVGAPASDADGKRYEKIYQSLKGSSPWAITSTAFNATAGTVTFQVKIVSDPGSTAGLTFRSTVYEDGLTCPGGAPGCQNFTEVHVRVTRKVLVDEPITISSIGQTQTITKTWTPDASWLGPKNVIGFIQHDPSKQIMQSGSTIPKPTYTFNYWSDPAQKVATAGTPAPFNVTIFNTGSGSDSFTATLAKVKGPAGWSARVTDGVTSNPTSLTWPLGPDTGKPFTLEIDPSTPGYGAYTLTLTQANNPAKVKTLKFAIVTEGLPILFVDDDEGAGFETPYIAALDAAGYEYGMWDNSVSLMPAPSLATFPIVALQVGFDGLKTASRNLLKGYLDAGGKLMLCGQDIGWYMYDPANSGCPDPAAAQAWYQTYLHATYVADSGLSGTPASGTINGVFADPVGNGWTFNIVNPPYTLYPDVVNPRDAQATNAFTFATGAGGAGLKVTDVAGIFHQIVYLPWGIEQIDANAQCPPLSGNSCRNQVMKSSIDWLGYKPMGSCTAGSLSVVPWLKLSRQAASNDILYTWDNSDANATAGFNFYSTDVASYLGNLNAGGGCGTDCTSATLSGQMGPTATLSNGISTGRTFHQVVSTCASGVEGPN